MKVLNPLKIEGYARQGITRLSECLLFLPLKIKTKMHSLTPEEDQLLNGAAKQSPENKTVKQKFEAAKFWLCLIWIFVTLLQSYTLWNLRWAVFNQSKVAKLEEANEHLKRRADQDLLEKISFSSPAEAESTPEQSVESEVTEESPEDFV